MNDGILSLLDRPIAFHRVFVDLTGSVTAALLLSQAVYWTRRASNGGWFYKTTEEWKEETGMGRYELENARKALKAKEFMEEALKGVPAKLHYRIKLDVLQASLLETSKLDVGKPASQFAGKQQTITETTTENTQIDAPGLFSDSEVSELFPTSPSALAELRKLIPWPELFASAETNLLLEQPGFPEAWRDFVNDRKERHKALTSRAAKMTLTKCCARPGEAAEALKLSIEQKWTSFEWEWVDKRNEKKAKAGAPGISDNTRTAKPVIKIQELSQRRDRRRQQETPPPPPAGRPPLNLL